MKRKLLVLLMVVCVLCVACGKKDDTDTTKKDDSSVNNNVSNEEKKDDTDTNKTDDSNEDNNGSSEEKKEIKIVSKDYAYDEEYVSYKVTYPQLEEDVNGINEVITKFAMGTADMLGYDKPEYNEELDLYEERTIEEKYEIKFQSDDVLSIAITGYFNIKSAAHPSSTARVLNIDLQTGKEIDINEKYVIDEEFVDKMLGRGQEQLDEEVYEYIVEQGRDKIVEYCKSAGTIYITEKGLGIYYETIHALGDYAEIVVE